MTDNIENFPLGGDWTSDIRSPQPEPASGNDGKMWSDWGSEKSDALSKYGDQRRKTSDDGLWNDWEPKPDPFATHRQKADQLPSGADDQVGDPLAFLGMGASEILSEEDRPIIGQLFEGMEKEIKPATGRELVQRIADITKSEQALLQKGDAMDYNKTITELRRSWGADFETNLAELKMDVQVLPFYDDIKDARLPDGRALFNDHNFVQWLHRLMRARRRP